MVATTCPAIPVMVIAAILFNDIVVRVRVCVCVRVRRGGTEAWSQTMVRMADRQPRAISVVVGNQSLTIIRVSRVVSHKYLIKENGQIAWYESLILLVTV